ncbi:MAG: hypothetical protein IPM26_06585 [Saprospiraceae bacterium]|nr:hypothetical protein [Saprospiraceae bacterium]
MRYSYAIYFFLLAVGLMSCKDAFTFSEAEKDEIVVKIEDKVLFKSQLKNLIHEDMDPQDSITVVNGFIENWIRDNLMIIEAEKNVPAGLDLNKLLADYRASLLVYNFEKETHRGKIRYPDYRAADSQLLRTDEGSIHPVAQYLQRDCRCFPQKLSGFKRVGLFIEERRPFRSYFSNTE